MDSKCIQFSYINKYINSFCMSLNLQKQRKVPETDQEQNLTFPQSKQLIKSPGKAYLRQQINKEPKIHHGKCNIQKKLELSVEVLNDNHEQKQEESSETIFDKLKSRIINKRRPKFTEGIQNSSNQSKLEHGFKKKKRIIRKKMGSQGKNMHFMQVPVELYWEKQNKNLRLYHPINLIFSNNIFSEIPAPKQPLTDKKIVDNLQTPDLSNLYDWSELLNRNISLQVSSNCNLDRPQVEQHDNDTFYEGIIGNINQLCNPNAPEISSDEEHLRLLMEENEYLRERLIVFCEINEELRQSLHAQKVKLRTIKKVNLGLESQIGKLQAVHQSSISLKEEAFQELSSKFEEQNLQHHKLKQHLDLLSKQLEEFYKKSRSYEQIIQSFEEQIQQKQQKHQFFKEEAHQHFQQFEKEIETKNQNISELAHQLEILNQQFEKQIIERQIIQKHKKSSSEQFSSDELQHLQTKTRKLQKKQSICMSIEDAEQLKYIIEEKESQHEIRIQQQRKQRIDLERELACLKKKVNFLTDVQICSSQFCDPPPKQSKQERKPSKMKAEPEVLIEMQLLINNLIRKKDLVEQHLQYEREQKEKIFIKMKKLQSQLNSKESEEEDQFADLLEKCLVELQKQRNQTASLKEEIKSKEVIIEKYQQQFREINFYRDNFGEKINSQKQKDLPTTNEHEVSKKEANDSQEKLMTKVDFYRNQYRHILQRNEELSIYIIELQKEIRKKENVLGKQQFKQIHEEIINNLNKKNRAYELKIETLEKGQEDIN